MPPFVEEAYLGEDRHVELLREEANDAQDARAVLVAEEVRPEVPRVGDALRAAQVDVDDVAAVLHELGGRQKRGRVVPGELHGERPIRAGALARRAERRRRASGRVCPCLPLTTEKDALAAAASGQELPVVSDGRTSSRSRTTI